MTCVVVLGMHRSGTSLVANILQTLGVNMGDRFREPDATSPYGYFEDLDWRAINKFILNYDGHTWYDPPDTEMILKVCDKFSVEVQINEIMVNLNIRGVLQGIWGFKDPRTCLTICGLHQYLPDPKYVLVLREEEEIVASLMERAAKRGYEESRQHWIDLTRQYIKRTTKFLETTTAPVCIVRYDNLVSKEVAPWVIRRLAQFVDCDEKKKIKSVGNLIHFKE